MGIVIALVVKLMLRRYVPPREERERGLPSRLGMGFLEVLLRLAPYAALLVSLVVLFQVFPSFPLGHTLALLLFLVVFFYRLALVVFSVLLAPEDGGMRILPLNDEMANYSWVWAVRFANYTAFYFLVIEVLFVALGIRPSFLFIRGLLLLVFPFMISVFIMQIAREIRVRYEGVRKNPNSPGEGTRKIVTLTIRYCPILALAYSWIIFLFLIARYESGFTYLVQTTLGTALTIVAVYLSLWFLDWLFGWLFAINARVRERFPGLEQKTNRYIRIMRRVLGIVVVIFGLGAIVQVWGIPVSTLLASRIGSLIMLRAIAIFITLGLIIAIIEVSQFVSGRLLQERKGKQLTKKRKTLIPMINTAIKIAVAFIGGIVILDQMGVNTKPILAGAGIVGLAVGFGAQTLVSSRMSSTASSSSYRISSRWEM